MATGSKYLYVASEVHVLTGAKPEKPGDPLPVKVVGPGLLANLNLTDAQIKSLPKSVLRPATADEIERADQLANTAERQALLDEQAGELAVLRTKQAEELAAAPADKKPALQEKHEKALTALQDKHTRALNE